MKDNVIAGIVWIIAGLIILYLAIKYPQKGFATNPQLKMYILAGTAILLGIGYLLGRW